MWIQLQVSDVQTVLSGPELAALQTAALAGGQGDPTAEVLAEVTNDVRGYVSACQRNLRGPDGTIPDELKRAALAIVAVNLIGRLPVKSFLTEARKTAATEALAKLRDVAACRFLIAQPITPDAPASQAAGPNVSLVTRDRRKFTGRGLRGI